MNLKTSGGQTSGPRRFQGGKIIRISLTAFVVLFSLFVAAIIITPLPLDKINHWNASPLVLDREGRIIHARLSTDSEWAIAVPFADMGKWLPVIVVSAEDKRFWQHPGLDPLALLRATAQNLMSGKVVSGASTITSQLIRIALPKERTFSAKAVEFLQAIKLNFLLNKEEVLTLYLNRAPMGGNIRGVEAAARIYFNKRAKDLSAGEAALLVGLLRGPSLYRPDRNPQGAMARRDAIIDLAVKRNGLAPDMAALAKAEPLPKGGPLPLFDSMFLFGEWALSSLPPGLTGNDAVARTSLWRPLQFGLQSILNDALQGLNPGITAAGVVVDNATGEVAAYVGNARFNREQGLHWVDCARSPRSPGSTLKPFAYLLAFAQGELTPTSLLADSPLSFAGQAPRNFDLTYRGPVKAGTALADSLNAPAVRVLRRVGGGNLLRFLRSLGLQHISSASEHYGDSLILGGCDATMLELLGAYRYLATLGENRGIVALHRAEGALPATRSDLLPAFAAAAYQVANSLHDVLQLDPLLKTTFSDQQRIMAYKTGTSYGFRDAWMFAYTPRWTMGIWFGREDGKAEPALSGRSLIAPIMTKLARRLLSLDQQPPIWFAAHWGLAEVESCALSGMATGPYCLNTRKAQVVESVWRTIPCTIHVLRNGQPVVVWPPELEHLSLDRTIELNRSAPAVITSPTSQAHLLLTPGRGKQKVPLRAEGAKGQVHWFMNLVYLGAQTPGAEFFWTLAPGRHTVSLLDEEGRTAKATFEVEDLREN
jgi:penicillin-binding protein 1C